MSNKAQKPGEFRTADLYFAAFLQVAGVRMIRADRDGTRLYFVFDSTVSNIDDLKVGWLNDTAKVAAQPYAHTIKSFKSMCHL